MSQIGAPGPVPGLSSAGAVAITGGTITTATKIVDVTDNTKALQFVLSSNTTGQTRLFTMPDASGTVTVLGNAVTGTGSVVLASSPTLVTPVIGAATATTVNKLTLTQPATGATLTLADGSTLATAGAFSVTFTASAATTLTLPTVGTLVARASTDTLSNKTISGGILTGATTLPSGSISTTGQGFFGRTTAPGGNASTFVAASSGSSGVTTVDTTFNQIVAESAGSAGLAFVVPTASSGGIIVANVANARDGAWLYSNSTGWVSQFQSTQNFVIGTAGDVRALRTVTSGTQTLGNLASGAFASAKVTAPGLAPGAGIAALYWVAGTTAGTAKLIAYAGTSTTPVTLMDNVGAGF